MLSRIDLSSIGKGLVAFWATWLTIVTATNLMDGLKQLRILPESWTLASYNFTLVAETVGTHGVPPSIAALLFAGVILWQAVAALLFWRAFAAMRREGSGRVAQVTQAFAVSLGLWAAFLVATELTVNYLTAATHKGTLIAQLASLIVVRLEESPRETHAASVSRPPRGAAAEAERRSG